MLTRDLMGLAMRETVSRPSFDRQPEADMPPLAPADYKQARDASYRAFEPIHHFCSLAVSRLVPEGGLVLDLGTGDGGFATYLARRRPDIQIIGVEPSQHLLDAAGDRVAEQGVEEHISLNLGDLTEISDRIPGPIDAIVSVLSLHSLPDTDALRRCVHEMSLVRIRTGCSLWLFDFCRPNLVKTAEDYAGTLLPVVPVTFRRECRDSLRSAFTYAEMSDVLNSVSNEVMRHAVSNGLKIYQAHWLERADKLPKTERLWGEDRLTTMSREQFRNIVGMFPKIVLPPHVK
jgi:ubiquinone/menaquinone biosynthesis C-methylase UbiE